MIDPTFRHISRLLILLFNNIGNDTAKKYFDEY